MKRSWFFFLLSPTPPKEKTKQSREKSRPAFDLLGLRSCCGKKGKKNRQTFPSIATEESAHLQHTITRSPCPYRDRNQTKRKKNRLWRAVEEEEMSSKKKQKNKEDMFVCSLPRPLPFLPASTLSFYFVFLSDPDTEPCRRIHAFIFSFSPVQRCLSLLMLLLLFFSFFSLFFTLLVRRLWPEMCKAGQWS